MPTNNETRQINQFVKQSSVETGYSEFYTQDGFTRLRSYLGNSSRGQPKVYTAPFAKGESMDKILSDWMSILVSLETEWPTLVDFEKDLAKKVGPMSPQKPIRDRLGDIRHYYTDVLHKSVPLSDKAIKATIAEFSSLRGLRIRSEKATLDLMKKSTSSGNPWHTKKRNVVQDIIPCTVIDEPKISPFCVHGTIQYVPWNYTAVLGWRGQEGGPNAEDTKQRVVWMFPFAVNLQELRVYQPLIEVAQSKNIVPAWVGNDNVDKHITRLFDTKPSDDLIVCTDFSKYDQHFNRDLQNAAKSILRSILTNELPSQSWLNDVFPAKYNIPLVWGYQGNELHMFIGNHGMASGSGGTNVDETLAHRSLQYEAAILNNSRLNPYSMCLGDDGILTYPGITVEQVVKAYESHGQECNVSKQYASTQDCVYLRRWHHKDYRKQGICVGVYSTCRALGRLRYLERFMDPEYWSPELVALRQLSIIENCKWHPLFHEFVEFCMKRDKYRLGIDIPGFLDNITKLAKEATDHMQDFLGYTKTLQGEGPTGIAEWEVVKYLKSHR